MWLFSSLHVNVTNLSWLLLQESLKTPRQIYGIYCIQFPKFIWHTYAVVNYVGLWAVPCFVLYVEFSFRRHVTRITTHKQYFLHFIMFSVITNIYNKKTKGPTLMEFFTATVKLKKFFWTTRDVRCVHHGWHGTHGYDIQVLVPHVSMTRVCRVTSLKLSKKNFFIFPVAVKNSI